MKEKKGSKQKIYIPEMKYVFPEKEDEQVFCSESKDTFEEGKGPFEERKDPYQSGQDPCHRLSQWGWETTQKR